MSDDGGAQAPRAPSAEQEGNEGGERRDDSEEEPPENKRARVAADARAAAAMTSGVRDRTEQMGRGAEHGGERGRSGSLKGRGLRRVF